MTAGAENPSALSVAAFMASTSVSTGVAERTARCWRMPNFGKPVRKTQGAAGEEKKSTGPRWAEIPELAGLVTTSSLKMKKAGPSWPGHYLSLTYYRIKGWLPCHPRKVRG